MSTVGRRALKDTRDARKSDTHVEDKREFALRLNADHGAFLGIP